MKILKVTHNIGQNTQSFTPSVSGVKNDSSSCPGYSISLNSTNILQNYRKPAPSTSGSSISLNSQNILQNYRKPAPSFTLILEKEMTLHKILVTFLERAFQVDVSFS